MLAPWFVDLLLFVALIGFAAKGYLTGFIRSFVTLVAVVIAFALSTAMPNITGSLLNFTVPPTAPNHELVNRLFAFFIFFGVVQTIGFLATGLLEKIGLGSTDRAVGCLVGVITGVFFGCLPGVILYQTPKAWAHKPNHRYFTSSAFVRLYHPIIKKIAGPPRAKRPK